MLKKTLIIILLMFQLLLAGDDASGPIKYRVNLSQNYTVYNMNERDKSWSRSLVENLSYEGKVVHFLRTNIPLFLDGEKVEKSVYRAFEEEAFYVIEGDTMLRIGYRWPYSPGVGGFSMHAPKSLNFIVCLNFKSGGVPHLSGTKVIEGTVSWKGYKYRRIQ